MSSLLKIMMLLAVFAMHASAIALAEELIDIDREGQLVRLGRSLKKEITPSKAISAEGSLSTKDDPAKEISAEKIFSSTEEISTEGVTATPEDTSSKSEDRTPLEITLLSESPLTGRKLLATKSRFLPSMLIPTDWLLKLIDAIWTNAPSSIIQTYPKPQISSEPMRLDDLRKLVSDWVSKVQKIDKSGEPISNDENKVIDTIKQLFEKVTSEKSTDSQLHPVAIPF